MTTQTPRTDANYQAHGGDPATAYHRLFHFARQLERELAAANARLTRLRKLAKDAKDCIEAFTNPEDEMPEDTGEFRDLKRVLVLLRAELEKNDG